jgi:hypothetical protein
MLTPAQVLTGSLITKALALAENGVPCFLCDGTKRPCTPQGYKNATVDPVALIKMWRRYPGSLVGVPTGEVSGFDVVDLDQRHGGGNWYAQHRGDLPPTRVHRTRSGGLHFFFRQHPGLRCSAGKVAAGVDVRAGGGYVIWWPAAGFPVVAEHPTAPWPEWLLAHMRTTPPPVSRVVVPDDAALMRLVRVIVGASSGERNNLTFWAACRAGEMVSSGLLRADTAVDVIAGAATRAGLSWAEAQRTAWSGIRRSGGTAHA